MFRIHKIRASPKTDAKLPTLTKINDFRLNHSLLFMLLYTSRNQVSSTPAREGDRQKLFSGPPLRIGRVDRRWTESGGQAS